MSMQKDPGYRMLGGYRFVLAMMVVLSHSFALTFPNQSALIARLGLGNIAVMAFFVLSGFIIAEAIDVFYNNRPVQFLANRALRLIPAYWLAVAVSILLHLAVADRMVLPDANAHTASMFTLKNLIIQPTAIIPLLNIHWVIPRSGNDYYFVKFFWAVLVEAVFYMTVAVAMFGWRVARQRVSLDLYVGATLLLALLIHGFVEFVHKLNGPYPFIPYFVLGFSLYVAMTRPGRMIWIICAASYALMLLHFSRYAQGDIPLSLNVWRGLLRAEAAIPVATLAIMPLALIACAHWQPSVRTMRLDRWLGDLTYPLYLNHYAVLVVFFSIATGPSWKWQAAAVVSSLAVAWLCSVAIEGPLGRLRTLIRGRPLLVRDVRDGNTTAIM